VRGWGLGFEVGDKCWDRRYKVIVGYKRWMVRVWELWFEVGDRCWDCGFKNDAWIFIGLSL
jgi:hypothetical protein